MTERELNIAREEIEMRIDDWRNCLGSNEEDDANAIERIEVLKKLLEVI